MPSGKGNAPLVVLKRCTRQVFEQFRDARVGIHNSMPR